MSECRASWPLFETATVETVWRGDGIVEGSGHASSGTDGREDSLRKT